MTYITMPDDLDMKYFPHMKETSEMEGVLRTLQNTPPEQLMTTWYKLKKTLSLVEIETEDGDEQ